MSRTSPKIGLTLLTISILLLAGRSLTAQQPEPTEPADTTTETPADAPTEAAAEPAAPADEPAPAETGTDTMNEPAAPGTGEPTTPAEAEAPEAPASAPAGVNLPPTTDPLEAEFADYLHFALMGQFEVADTHAKAILNREDVNPLGKETAAKLLVISEKYKNSVETLLVIINNTPISDNAKKILELVREAHRLARMEPERIIANIRRLAGSPVQQSVGLERLRESGEYSVPWMIDMLGKAKEQSLHPFIVRSLPLLGKKAINPLVEALAIPEPAVRGVVAEALGRIGYPQALPYLARLAADPQANAAVRQAANAAIKRIVTADPAVRQRPAAELFRELAEQYYRNIESLRPDVREPKANVWFVRDGFLTPVEVPPEIYQFVMCMRAAQASLALQPDQAGVVALWLAANINREAALGLDVTSEDQVESADATRPKDFPRSIYFARTFGPVYCQLALARAIQDRNPQLALGAIAALNVTAGPAAMVEPGPDGASLAAALRFPDALVRIRAALALARALPQKPFRDADQVVPVLASAVQLTGKKNYAVVEPETTLRERLHQELTTAGATVVAAGSFNAALDQARRSMTHLDGIFLATDVDRPTSVEAIRALAGDPRFALTPVVLLVKSNDNLKADRAAEIDSRVGRVFYVGESAEAKLTEQLLARRNQVAVKYGQRDLSPELSLSLSLEAAGALRSISVNRSPVLDSRGAEGALAAALASPSEELRVAAAAALSLINSPPAQRAIAAIALSGDQTESLRKAAFGSLAESARRFGSLLEPAATQKLIEQAVGEPNLALRTAASQALGAMSLSGKPVAQIIVAQPQ